MAKRTNQKAGEGGTGPDGGRRGASPPPQDARIRWMERMRQYRARREPDVGVDKVLRALERQFATERRDVGDVVDVWNELAPKSVRDTASIGGVAQGTLTLVASSSGAMYELSRVLRDGLERQLVSRLPGRVRRIRVRVGGDA